MAVWAAVIGSLVLADDTQRAGPDHGPPSISSPREMLELLGVADRLRNLREADFPPEGDELLWSLLHAVRRFSLLDLDRWERKVSPGEVQEDVRRFRGEVVAWKGTVTQVTVHAPPAEAAEGFNLSRYYRGEMEVADGDKPAKIIIYALAIPKEWQSAGPLRARAGVKGLVATLAGGDGPPQPVIVAQRIAWYPETVLGDLEMDVGLFDELSTRPEVTGEDRECFYQLLAAVGRVGTNQLVRAVPKESRNASVEPLFNQPQRQRGRLVELTGTARRAVLRRVEDRDILARFGIDHYYEVEIFTDDSQGNPLTFCVRELPKGFPDGDKITEPVRVAGFFFKKWGYRSSASGADAAGAVRRQLAPLLIGREPVWLETPPADQRFANGVFLVLFVVLTVVLWLVVSRLTRSDDKFHKQVVRRFATPPEKSLNDLQVEDNGGPDIEVDGRR